MKQLPLVDRLSSLVGRKVCWLFLIAVIVSVYEVVSDFVFNAPTVWVHDLTIMLCSACFLLGGAYAMQRREHIRITVVYDYFPANVKRWVDVVSLALALFYLALLAYFATAAAIESIGLVERSGRAWDFPMPMVVRIFFSLGAILLTVQIASHLFDLIRGRETPKAESTPDSTEGQ
ncbi:MAG: TRAP transporter small permease subunit [Rhizobiales bacterium]|nr:TRAP transporter small permease subunit [Hyphomicrobiales bacterium]